jgi:hypothetical protein
VRRHTSDAVEDLQSLLDALLAFRHGNRDESRLPAYFDTFLAFLGTTEEGATMPELREYFGLLHQSTVWRTCKALEQAQLVTIRHGAGERKSTTRGRGPSVVKLTAKGQRVIDDALRALTRSRRRSNPV